jgi:hypothetical protein
MNPGEPRIFWMEPCSGTVICNRCKDELVTDLGGLVMVDDSSCDACGFSTAPVALVDGCEPEANT